MASSWPPAASVTWPTATSSPRRSTHGPQCADVPGCCVKHPPLSTKGANQTMGLTNVAIRRPLFMLMVIGALLVVGLVSWTKLGVDLLPALNFPIVVVTTVYPGASPEAVDTLITKRVEDAVVTINDIDYISSNSTEGVSSVVIFFKDNAPKDASIDVERKVSGIRGQLPTDAKDPSVGKYDPNAQPILQLTVSGKRDLAALQRLAEDKIQKQLEGTNGV